MGGSDSMNSGDSALVTLVLPVYNERDNIRTAIEAIHAQVRYPFRIFLVYDSEEDNTLPVVRAMQDKSVTLVKNRYGRGALNAIKTGLESVETKYAVVTMADLSDPPSVVNAMIETAEREGADIVCASRYMKGGKQIGGPVLKGLMSRTAGLTLHWFAGVPTHDATNSFKLYRKSWLETVTVESRGGFELGLEMVAKAYTAGRIIREVPTTWTDRSAGTSHFKIMAWLPHYLKWYFYAYRARFFRK